jgi:hypothetical protein
MLRRKSTTSSDASHPGVLGGRAANASNSHVSIFFLLAQAIFATFLSPELSTCLQSLTLAVNNNQTLGRAKSITLQEKRKSMLAMALPWRALGTVNFLGSLLSEKQFWPVLAAPQASRGWLVPGLVAKRSELYLSVSTATAQS